MKLTLNNSLWKGELKYAKYKSLAKSPALTFEPHIATLTVNINGLLSDELALDTNNCGEAFVQELIQQRIILKPHRSLASGYCIYPVARLVK